MRCVDCGEMAEGSGTRCWRCGAALGVTPAMSMEQLAGGVPVAAFAPSAEGPPVLARSSAEGDPQAFAAMRMIRPPAGYRVVVLPPPARRTRTPGGCAIPGMFVLLVAALTVLMVVIGLAR
ncbi:MAG: hypothetical protein OJF49_000922 [Ktedonobacterales bacterium]|jgi:hypothetical protein|nr:MAG: hypothetical protein OJF49_000922 [Ktedonobacterales bacterium]